jgi:hypothetical protein
MATNERSAKTASKQFTRVGVLAVAVGILACSGSSTAPTPAVPVPPDASPPAADVVVIRGGVVDTASRHLADVKVEMIDGPQAGASTMTDAAGQFSFSGSFPRRITFRATKVGYADLMETRIIAPGPPPGATASVGLTLVSLVPSANIAGDYTLTFVADSTCDGTPSVSQTGIPEELRRHTYEASITAVSTPSIPPNTIFNVALSGASFVVQGNISPTSSLVAHVAGDYVAFLLDPYEFDGYVTERLAPATYLELTGSIAGSVSTSGASSVPFDGTFAYCVKQSEVWQPWIGPFGCYGNDPVYASCHSKNHRVVLTRR